MGDDWRPRFREVLGSLNVSEYGRATGRPLRTLQDWQASRRDPPPEAISELVAYLRSKSVAFATAAAELEAVAPSEARGGTDEQA